MSRSKPRLKTYSTLEISFANALGKKAPRAACEPTGNTCCCLIC
jgi:hypothetical protein